MLGCPEKNLDHGVKGKRDKMKRQDSEAQIMDSADRGKCLVLILSGGEPYGRF